MRSISVITEQQPTKDSVIDIVKSMGGIWIKGDPVESGTIERENAAVFVYYYDDIRFDLGETELAQFTSAYSKEPRVAISIDIGHREKSEELAWLLMDNLIDTFGGQVEATSLCNENKSAIRRTPSGTVYMPKW